MEEKTFFKGEWKAVEKLGEGSFGIVYKAVKEQYGVESYSAIKQIMIPQTDEYFSKLKSQGMTQSDIEKSYDSQVKKWVEEIQFLNQFKDNENIVSIEDFEVLERKDKPGRTINIRMELLQNIDDHVMDRTITDKKVLKMASDILKALEECEEKNVVHRDIKPENVFVNSRGTYKLGDFGEAKSIEKTVSNMSKKGTENYMAPEIYKGERGSRSVDTYSLGIMLYKYFNNNRLPFIPDYPNSITFEDMESALEKRMSGKEMKPPVKASNNIARIILKACSYKPNDRYKSAMEFRNDIEKELRSITNPMKLFDFQEGEIEKDNSISDFDKTTGIFEDDTNSKTNFDKTMGIFDDYSKNEEKNNKHIKKSREIIEKVNTENLKADDEIIIEKNKKIEEAYVKKQFGYQLSETDEIIHASKNETKIEIKDVKYEEHFSGQIKYKVPVNYKKYLFVSSDILTTKHYNDWSCGKFFYDDFEITVGYNFGNVGLESDAKQWLNRSINSDIQYIRKGKNSHRFEEMNYYINERSTYSYNKKRNEYIYILDLGREFSSCWYFKITFNIKNKNEDFIENFIGKIKFPSTSKLIGEVSLGKLEDKLSKRKEEMEKFKENNIISKENTIDEIALYLNNIAFDNSLSIGYNRNLVDKFLNETYSEVEILKNENDLNYENEVKEIKNKIKNIKFSKKFMGYNVKQVDEFLDKLIDKLDFSLKIKEKEYNILPNDIKANDENITEENKNIEDVYVKKKFEYQYEDENLSKSSSASQPYIDNEQEKKKEELNDKNNFINETNTFIKNKKFSKQIFNGYSIDEVDKFLEDIRLIIEELKYENDSDYEFKLSKIEFKINEKKFNKMHNGYSVIEVDEFLDKLIDNLKFSLKVKV